MRNSKWIAYCLSLSVVLGLGGFLGYHGHSQAQNPRVTILGDTSKIPAYVMSELPTGFEKWLNGREELELDIDTEDPDDPNALFLISEGLNDNLVDEVLDYARKLGKKQIYLMYEPLPPPDAMFIPHKPDLRAVLESLSPVVQETLEALTILPSTAYASTVTPPPSCAIPSPCTAVGGCTQNTFPDDDPGDGIVAKAVLCIQFVTSTSWWDTVKFHLVRNISNYNEGSATGPKAFANTCMNFHNGSNFSKNPANLTVKYYKNPADITLCPNNCGCVPSVPPMASPRVSRNQTISVASEGSCDRNSWGVTRHEEAHTYGYEHSHMDINLDSVQHCISGPVPHEHRFF